MSESGHGLATPEGVDEGSADVLREGGDGSPDGTGRPHVEREVTAGSPGPLTAERGEPTGHRAAGGDVLGEPPHGAPVDGAQAAAPDDMESAESRAARGEVAPGQQLQEGEG